ncbi:acyl-CoA thioesterase [Skeletonema marinoi]|uniref:Acyl-CoA thioesterase n=1 Tax=Skeletonema marinoi TaxID=267567 RepID=A0AAD8Y729_9STRA|nr:acyl-CoA thioesterase [Skeletonema marinoi]
MGIIHIPRTIAAALRGAIKRRLSPLSDQEISLVGTKDVPHIYSSRAGLFDVDLMGHMNNASYLQHAELARWEWSSFGGSLAQSFKTKSFFIVTASMIRYRREIVPFKRFDVETRLVGLDDRNLWVYQTFHHHVNRENKQEESDGPTRGKILAQILTQAVMAKPEKGVINPRAWLEDNSIYSSSVLDGIMNEKGENIESIFDEKAKRFTHLEDILKRSAANYDDKVPK